jgi:hypothetical protein
MNQRFPMRRRKIIKNVLLCSSVGLCVFFGFKLFEGIESTPLSAETVDDEEELLGKKRGKAYVSVRVEDDFWNHVTIDSASLEDQNIKLNKHANLFGLRGTLNTYMAPGKYTVWWTITKSSKHGQKVTLSYSKNFSISNRDKKVSVTIHGERASIY